MKRKKKTEENVEDTKKGIKEGMKEKKQIYGELTQIKMKIKIQQKKSMIEKREDEEDV